MKAHNIPTLKINENFKRLIPPLSSEELQQLEQNLVRDGCREPLCVWNDTLIDGHNRYEICTRLQIPFIIRRIHFESAEEATAWICANQLGRRNITDETRKYLIGKRFEMEKLIGAHNAFGINQHKKKKEVKPKMWVEPPFEKSSKSTSKRLGEGYRVSHATIDKYGAYSHALDSLVEIVPAFVQKILSGQIKISQTSIIDLAQLSPQMIQQLSKRISDEAVEFIGYASTRQAIPKRQESPKTPAPPVPTISVKDMPVYDPDAEISSLVLTIPSWISSIDRTRSSANLQGISSNARSKLDEELSRLKKTIDTMLFAIKEEM